MNELLMYVAGGLASIAAWYIRQILKRLDDLEEANVAKLQRLSVLETRLADSLKYIEDHVNRIFHNLETITERLNTK